MSRVALLLAVACGAIAVGGSAASPSASSLRLVTVARGFASPVLATQAPGEPGRIYVVEQPGRIRVVERGRVKPGAFLDVRSLVALRG